MYFLFPLGLDYISSVPPIRMPLDKLVPVFRKHGVMILVDGAHTPGQIPLNMEHLGVDFYTGKLVLINTNKCATCTPLYLYIPYIYIFT